MNVRFGLTCVSLLISCWCSVTSSVSAASNGVRPRRQSRIASLNEYLTPPAPPNGHAFRSPGPSRHPRNHGNPGGPQHPSGPVGSGSSAVPPFRRGKILGPPAATDTPGYFSRLMGWLNPFGGGSPPQRPPPPPQHRPDNIHQGANLSPGYLQPPAPKGHGPQSPPWNQPPVSYGSPASSYGPPAASYGPPAPSYGPPAASYGMPTSSSDRYPSANPHSHSPSQSGPPYLPPQRSKNCDPCNHLPWVPLYNGVNTVDSRYAASSADVKIPESLESTINQHQGGVTNVYHAPSHEVKTPDFNYGPPLAGSTLNTNLQASSSSSAKFNHNNQNHHFPQSEYRSPFSGPIPNPHLYTGAMPPLYKAKPFDSLPQGTDTSFDPPPIPQSNHQDTSHGGGNAGSDFGLGNLFESNGHYNPSSDLGSFFPGPQSQQYNQQPFQNGGSSFQPQIDNPQQNQQSYQNGGSSFQPGIDDQQHNQPPHSAGSSDEGYVDELPPGAETVSGPDDDFPPSSPNENHSNANGASNGEYQQALHASTQHEVTSGTSTVNVGVGQSDAGQGSVANSGSINQATNYGTHVSQDGQHIIHYEQSPVIDLSSVGDEKRKGSNDSSASSSISSDALEDPPVILQNADGTYGINATWSGGDPSKISWPDDDALDVNVASATSSPLSNEFSSESGQRVRFEDVEVSPSSLDVSVDSSSGGGQENRPSFTGYEDLLPRNDSDFRDFRNESKAYEGSGDAQGSRQAGADTLQNSELNRNYQSGVYPGLLNFGDRESSGFRHISATGSTTDEPFLKALVKSYDSQKNDARPNGNQAPPRDTGTGEAWFNPRLLHNGASFQPPQSVNPVEGNFRPVNRSQGVKRNKQVQIIIPYTSQYTPKPFHPSTEDWSTKTTPGRTQGRKIQIFETNRDYLAQETQRVEAKVSQILQALENSSGAKEVTRSPTGVKANTSIDVLRLQKNIDNWTIQEYSRGTTASTTIPKFSRPYLSPSKKIPDEYLTTTEPVEPVTDSLEDTRREISSVLAGFSFNDLEHEGSASSRIDVSHVEVSSHNEVSSAFPEETKFTTPTSVTTSTTERDSWDQLPVSISPFNKERVYVVTPQTLSTVPTNRKKSEDRSSNFAKNSKEQPDFKQFESIERAYQVLPQAVNNLAVASTGPATIPLWGIMEHEVYAASFNQTTTTPTSSILYSGHSKVSHTRQ